MSDCHHNGEGITDEKRTHDLQQQRRTKVAIGRCNGVSGVWNNAATAWPTSSRCPLLMKQLGVRTARAAIEISLSDFRAAMQQATADDYFVVKIYVGVHR